VAGEAGPRGFSGWSRRGCGHPPRSWCGGVRSRPMGDLEQRVRELTGHAVARDPGVLEATTGGEPLKGSQAEVNRIVLGALSGIHEALLEIARAIDAQG